MHNTAERLLRLLLRLAAGVLLTAFGAMFLPTGWMQSIHESLGLGPFPRSPLVEYLTRSIAALYGFHGVLVLIVASDLQRYRPLARYVGVMNVVFGVAITVIDLLAPMPLAWTLLEGPPIAVFGIVILVLLRAAAPAAGSAGGS